jgi:hypothetical protein
VRAAPGRCRVAVSLTAQTGQSDDLHSPEAWTSMVAGLIRPLSRSIAVLWIVDDVEARG